MIDINKIKKAALKGINIYPTTIVLKRLFKTQNVNGIGFTEEEKIIGTYKIFFDDSKKSLPLNLNRIEEAGEVFKVSNIKMLIVIEDNAICKGDYFILDNKQYTVIYPGELVKDVYNSDLEMVYIKNG